MIAIIDYEAGNLTSVSRALRHIGIDSIITADPEKIKGADRIIFPGVGAAGSAMASLRRLGLDRLLIEAVSSGKPILGICLGTQVFLEYSEENLTSCLGIIDGSVESFRSAFQEAEIFDLKIPHMGWNRLRLKVDHPVTAGICAEDEFYFVHSYYPVPREPAHVIAATSYGIEFASVIGRDNVIATQFHPEKSGAPGLRMLKNFSGWTPC